MHKNIATQQTRSISHQKTGSSNQQNNHSNLIQINYLTSANEPIFKDVQEDIFPINNVSNISQDNLKKSSCIPQANPNTPNQSNQQPNWLIPKTGLGPKFKPLQEVEKPQLMTNINKNIQMPRSTGAELSMLQNNERSLITLVGVQEELHSNIYQQKTLKFQMKSMQQDKVRQVKAVQQATPKKQPVVVNNFVNSSEGFRNLAATDAVQNPVTLQYPVGMQMTMDTPNKESSQNLMEMQNFKDPHGVSNVTGMQNVTGTNKVSSNMYNVTQKPVPPITPSISPKPMNPSNQQRNSINRHSGRSKNYPVDPYAVHYPKGIPRSFLVQQQQQTSSQKGHSDGPIWPSYQLNPPMSVQPPVSETHASTQSMVITSEPHGFPEPYSPSELYTDFENSNGPDFEDEESQETSSTSQKRLSAFQRLGPQTQPKKPKLTISVTVNDDQEVREVVDETEEVEEITPVHLREDIIVSTDETVMKYLKAWPWKRNVVVKKSVTARNSKTVMMLEREQMEEIYDKDTLFVQVTVKGYPSSWKKEQVLDTLMENIRGYTFIPCFIEFNLQECKFLTLRCRSALLSLHKCGFIIRKNDVELTVTIAQTELTLNQLDFVPRLVLRKRLNMCIDQESKLNLSAFTLKEDISHFIYFPLNRLINQMEIFEMHNEITWNYLTDLNLSHNRIESLDGFDLEQSAPKLKHLDLSHNCLEKITLLLKIRNLPLKTIHLEGNPLCRNYIDPNQYIKAVKMMFSSVNTIDGVAVPIKGEMPKFHRNYCPEDAQVVVEKFLEVYFPLLDGDIEHRELLEAMYDTNANMTITFSYKMGFSPIYKCFRTLFAGARNLEQGNMDIIKGSKAIAKTIANWPHMEHDPVTFTVDVIYHNDSTTILRVDGVLKLTRESLADDEYLVAFSRTVVLHTRDGVEYTIQAETLYWSIPIESYARSAFTVTTGPFVLQPCRTTQDIFLPLTLHKMSLGIACDM
ncbi:unnamed protein product [Arctia plantaginis]|uniref:NTF2 domain-containing protein n=1 Tax=Arctia plantaginis TaxID=874455 RepID=A0A8S1B8Q1_ARCPL|nr:unnamed protein product [Arctia plantaginis]